MRCYGVFTAGSEDNFVFTATFTAGSEDNFVFTATLTAGSEENFVFAFVHMGETHCLYRTRAVL